MRRVLLFVTLVVIVVGAAVAVASSSNYSGTVKGGGSVLLRIKKSHGAKRVTRFDFRHVGVKCKGKHRAATGNLSFTKPVTNNEFSIRGVNPKGGVIRINGKIKGRGKTAKGTIRLDGRIHVDGIAGYAHNCHSGVKHWTAKRG
jgi:hypothetical protein